LGTQNFAVDEVIAASALWCPNSAATSCPRVRDSSMRAMIDDGDIAVVDGTQNDGKALSGKIIVAWYRKTGLTLSRFLMMATEIGGLAGRFCGEFGRKARSYCWPRSVGD
jgi:SOS-response transcriptional repressor LexA